MRILLKLVFLILLPLVLLAGCAEPTAPAEEQHLLVYSIEGSDDTLQADVTYMSDTGIVKLSNQSLPWTVTIDIGSSFISDAYLKAEIPQSEVFIPYMSGTTDAVPELKKLHDADADFIAAGAAAGDIVYIDPSTTNSTKIAAVDDTNTLSLDSDMFQAGTENYYLYKVKSLTATVSLDGTPVDAEVSMNEKVLSCLVQTPVQY